MDKIAKLVMAAALVAGTVSVQVNADPGWTFPSGQFGVYKYTGSRPGHVHDTRAKDTANTSVHQKNYTYEMAVGALRNRRPVTIEYEVLTTGYGYSYTAGPTSEIPNFDARWP